MKTQSENACFGGVQGVYTYRSATTDCDMTFGLYLPPQAKAGKVPVLWYLSGLTCTHENAMVKAGAQTHAALHGIALVFPDTSPRGEGVADDAAYDLGQGAGFYVNAVRDPWARNFRMWDHVTADLPDVLFDAFPLDAARQGITGHSMGGHGALTMAAHDATLLMRDRGFPGEVLIDQGTKDQFLDLLKPEALAEAMAARRQAGVFRMQPGYDHSYFFVSTFMADHVAFHAERLVA